MSQRLRQRLHEVQWTVEVQRELDQIASYVESDDARPCHEIIDELRSIETVNNFPSDTTVTLDF